MFFVSNILTTQLVMNSLLYLCVSYLQVQRNQLDQHLRGATQCHLELACRKIREQNKDIENIQAELKSVKANQNSKKYVWKISNFRQTLKEAQNGVREKIVSDPFYTAPQEYKLQAQLYPNGYGRHKGTYLSAFVFTLKGEYDAILPWPFAKEVILTIVDQQQNVADRQNIRDSLILQNEGPNSRGCCCFYFNLGSYEELGMRKYIVDDTLFLRVEISG